LLFVYVIVATPADTAVTNPVVLTFATKLLEDSHGEIIAAVAEPVNCDVRPTQADNVPVTDGRGLIINVLFAIADVPHSLVTVNYMV